MSDQAPKAEGEGIVGQSASTAGLGAWLPIETAPKDETKILIYTKYGNFYVVSYDDTFSAPWRVRNDEGLNEKAPTHWMPLPEAPNVELNRDARHHRAAPVDGPVGSHLGEKRGTDN